MANNEWLDSMLNNKISKEAMESQGTDKQDHYERKVKAHDWIKGISDLDPVQVEAEYQEKLKQEAMVLGKTAALDDVIADGVTEEETVNKDYKRGVVSLSDYALAELLAEARGHDKQNTSEMFYELKEKAKAEVASSREKAEKALLELIPNHTMLDWQKAFKEFTKDAVPAEAKEKDLFRSDVPEKAHDFEHPAEDKFKVPADQDKAIPGNGREADERTDATKEAGVLQEDITKGLGKDASLKTAHCGHCGGDMPEKKADENLGSAPMATGPDQNDAVVREGFRQMCEGAGEDMLIDLLTQYMPVEEMKQLLDDFSDEGEWAPGADHYEHAGIPMATANLRKQLVKKAMGCPVCGSEGKDLKNGQKEHIACEACGLTYARASLHDKEAKGHQSWDVYLNNKHIDTVFGYPGEEVEDVKRSLVNHDGYDPNITVRKNLVKSEIKSQASKKEVIQKIAELKKSAEVASPWEVRTDESGNEVIARVEQPTNVKESEEAKPEEILK